MLGDAKCVLSDFDLDTEKIDLENEDDAAALWPDQVNRSHSPTMPPTQNIYSLVLCYIVF